MIKLKIKLITFFVFVLFLHNNPSNSAIETNILFKIDKEIITNIDLENEKKFLIFLNPKLDNLSADQIESISIKSLKNRKIKEIELRKFFDFNDDDAVKNSVNQYIENFLTNSNYASNLELKTKIKEFNLDYNFFEFNFLIDNLWREFIYKKYISKIKIDSNNLKKQIENQENKIEELNLSEILFILTENKNLKETLNQIKMTINSSGFEAAASIYSIAESKKFGGKLGWVRSNQISPEIYSEIKKTNKITEPIKTNNGYLIININEKRMIKQTINVEKELNKLIKIETDKELNKLGYIYFNKIKKRTFISEK